MNRLILSLGNIFEIDSINQEINLTLDEPNLMFADYNIGIREVAKMI